MSYKDLPKSADQEAWDFLLLRPQLAIPITAQGGTIKLEFGGLIFLGYAFRETNTQAGTIDFYDGQDATGSLIASDTIASLGQRSQATPGRGVLCKNGLTIVVGGTAKLQGAIWAQY